ncbi:DUF5682 family protein [Candidatus Chloroploca asiatica]|uniref:Uncharacterized protein n=1 Tax=Candidatus Chloroploca asiatica TaxID=1506545 RepID=A0A2H3KRA0_9CHLR|nr:DUF5682 family protein [Candidatus Chloroploca asiatica]PDW01061.1 hypothetical protein A9Q02_07845 [Candidatus Chloroploca asiatica]
MAPATHHIFGIRHHGPGSARSLRRALTELAPDLVLVEGPPEADPILPLLAHPALEPPIALLVYATERPDQAVFYPFARFSPEFQAITYALHQQIPVRCMDLPQFHQLALEKTGEAHREAGVSPILHPAEDPLGALALAAGYSDGERWWEELVEQRRDDAAIFSAVLEAMSALREDQPTPTDPYEAYREAWMRRTLRQARREGFQRIAVVCGAWHAPALVSLDAARTDDQLLKGLPKIKTAATLAPWTYGRLTVASGYGAGIASPGWYDHLWAMGEAAHDATAVTIQWMTRVARLLRQHDLDASSAHIIEAVRLAEALAALREHPVPGLSELEEAARAVFCTGNDAPMRLIHQQLIVGERIGSIPDETPLVPLQQDLRQQQRRLRMKPTAERRLLELDLRKANHREQSALVRQLSLLGLAWGEPGDVTGTGTFRETWWLQWQPAFDVALIEAAIWGTTVRGAATARTLDRARKSDVLGDLVAIVNQALFADLPDAISPLMDLLQQRATHTNDAGALMDALTSEDRQTRSSLVNSLRYGSVRELDTSLIAIVVDGMVTRICIGLSNVCTNVNDEAAATMSRRIAATNAAIGLLGQPAQREQWLTALAHLVQAPHMHGLIAGQSCRLLLDVERLSNDAAARLLSQALSPSQPPTAAAAWIEGLLQGSGMFIVHDEQLWHLIDTWLGTLNDETFQTIVPLLRRTFATFTRHERHLLGERVKQAPGARPREEHLRFDVARAEAALARIQLIVTRR